MRGQAEAVNGPGRAPLPPSAADQNAAEGREAFVRRRTAEVVGLILKLVLDPENNRQRYFPVFNQILQFSSIPCRY